MAAEEKQKVQNQHEDEVRQLNTQHHELTMEEPRRGEEDEFEDEFKDYGETQHSIILKTFGDELTYNELAFYARDVTLTSYLEVVIRRYNIHRTFYKTVSVIVDKKEIGYKTYRQHHSCDMFVYLTELDADK